MRQPELGNKVNEARSIKGLTQKELSEACNVDIRTIQRIESGEVVPRMSTLRILAAALECNQNIFIGYHSNIESKHLRQILLNSFITGILYFINLIFYSLLLHRIFPASPGAFITLSVIHLLTSVLFYFGFYKLGLYRRNKALQIASLIIMITVPLFVVTDIISIGSVYQFTIHLKRLFIIILGVNGIVFGIGLLIAKSKNTLLYKISGILQILIGPMFIFRIPVIQMIGLWLSIPLILLLLFILLLEFQELKQERNSN